MRILVRNQIIEVLDAIVYDLKAEKNIELELYLDRIDQEFLIGFSECKYHIYSNLLMEIRNKIKNRRMNINSSLDIIDALNKVKELLLNEEEVKLEVVFFPYKASMWDALESIYLAALKNPKCNAYAIPIPYYEKDETGNLAEKFYEGDKFPEEQEMLYYANYDIETHHPDVIFIHNAYDDKNNVTSVLPKYYSCELIKYTEHLVYVPYFVARENAIGLHYCILPGVRNAWRIYVQNEEIKKVYTRWNPKKTIVGIGSPKVDSLIKKEKRGCVIPETWKNKIENRKIVLLNTHISEIMDKPEFFLDNIRYIFSIIKEIHNKAILLWRPHPLTIETFAAHAMDYLEEYKSVIDFAKKEKYIIYDDSSDVDRALVISDMYIGHPSSLLILYKMLGKPIRILENKNIREWEEKAFGKEFGKEFALSIYASCYVNNELWFVPRNINGLFKMCLENEEITYITNFKKEGMFQSDLFVGLIFYKGKIWFFPYSANQIYILDLATMKIENLKVPINTDGVMFKFGAMAQVESEVFLFPHSVKTGLKIDMETKLVEEMEDFVPVEIQGRETEQYEHCFVGAEKVYAAYKGTNVIYEYDKKGRKVSFYKAGGSKEHYNLILAEGEWLFLFSDTGGCVSQYTKDYQFVRKKVLIKQNGIMPTGGFVKGRELWVTFFPDILIKWDLTNDNVYKWGLNAKMKNFDINITYGAYGVGKVLEIQNQIVCLPGDYGVMLKYDELNETMQESVIDVSWEWLRGYLIHNAHSQRKLMLNIIPMLEYIRFGCMIKKRDERQILCAGQILGDVSGNVGKKIIDDVVNELWRD